MKIPMGDFGNAVAQPGRAAQIRTPDALGAATDRMLGTVQQIQQQEAAAQTRLDERHRIAQASLALAKSSNALHDAHDEVARGVLDGSIPTAKAAAEFQGRATKIREAAVEGHGEYDRAQMEAHFTGQIGTLGRALGTVVQRRKQTENAASLDQFGEEMQREAVRVGPGKVVERFGSLVDFLGSDAGLNDAQRAKLKQGFSEKAHASFYDAAGVGALTNGDDASLGALVAKLKGKDGDPLDPTKRAQLIHQFFGWQQSIVAHRASAANKAETEARARFNDAVDIHNKATEVLLSGGKFSPDFIRDLTTRAAGTDMQAPVANLIAAQATVSGFATRTAAQRQATIERMQAERATTGTDPADERLLGAMRTMHERLNAAAVENPWNAYQQAGGPIDNPVLDAANPAAAGQILAYRMQNISTVEAWAGRKVSPLQPQEIEQVQKMVKVLPPDQAATMLAGFGAKLGDSERVAAMGKQLHDKDGALGLAMMYANAQTSAGRHVAELVLIGQQALADKRAAVDSAAETGWKSEIAKQIRGAYSNREVEDAGVQAAYFIAAANYVKDGSADIDRAVRLATGGIIERNGQKVPLPYGMSEADFEKRLSALKTSDLNAQAYVNVGATTMTLPEVLKALPKATLVHAGQGLYNVRAGATLVTNEAGDRLLIKVAP